MDLQTLHEKLVKGEITSADLVKEALEKANASQEEINAFVTILDNAEGKEVTDNVLSGIPYACKDNISTKDVLTTASSNILKDYVPIFDATCVSRLNDANAVLIGKTVLDELAMGGTGTTGHTGVVRNPWDKERLIGGSSAGSAAAVAKGIVPYALGSDTGDSIRKPAYYGGIVGYKPTYGVVSRYGLFPFACSLDHVGCFTRSVKDAAIVIDAIKGLDNKDMTSHDLGYNLVDGIENDVKGKKLFYLKEVCNLDFDDVDDEFKAIIENFNQVVEKYKKLGAIVEEVSVDKELLKAISPVYFTISCAEATSNNSNLTGVSFGPRAKGDKVMEMIFNARTEGFSELIKRRFVIGSYVLQKENQEKLFLNAGRIRRVIAEKFAELFNSYDAMILPGAGTVAPKFKSETIDKLSDRYLILENHMQIGNFGGFPSITIPTGFVNNLPVGVSITSGVNKDNVLLNIAYNLEKEMEYKGQIAGGNK